MKSGMPTVALINPPVYDFSAYDLWAKPLGLLVIAECLRKAGLRVSLVDSMDPFHPALEGLCAPKRREFGTGKFFETEIPKPAALKDVRKKYHRYGLPPDRFEQAMREAGDADAVLVSCAMTYWYPGAFEAIALVRKVWPAIPILLGGIYTTLCREHSEKFSGADAVLPGPFEKSLSLFKDATGIRIDASHAPLYRPALDLYAKLKYAPILLSRGCPFRCDYCASGILHNKYARRAPEEVVEVIEEMALRGISDFAFYDDALLWDAKDGLIPLLEAILSRTSSKPQRKIRLHAPNGLHFSKIDRELAKLMRRAGFVTIRIGVESLSKESHEQWGGKADPESLASVVSYLFDAGYTPDEVGAYLLAGIPGQKAVELEKDVKTLLSLGVRPYLAEYSPLPGTPMFERARVASRYDIANEPVTQNNSVLPCMSPDFTFEDLQRLKQLTWPQTRRK